MRRSKVFTIFLAAFMLIGMTVPQKLSAKDSDGDVVIVIDAGHGGHDPGSEAVTGAYEKDCNLAIALAMREELGKYKGVKVYLTRSDDQWLTNMGRAMVAASLEADFLISIHNNSGSSSNSGCVAYRSLNRNYGEATDEMGRLITDNLAALGLRNGGVQTRPSTQYDGEDYYTLIGEGVRAGVPSVIVEHCFLSNPQDAALLTNPDGTVNKEMAAKMGAADAAAVAQYFGLSRRSAPADGGVTLERGCSVALLIPEHTGNATWYSSDKSCVTVDENGAAAAVGAGTANITYKLGDGTGGGCTVTVKKPEPVALTGCLDPTFYESMAEFLAIKPEEAFGYVSYSDGRSVRVVPRLIGFCDRSMIGIQDIEIEYGGMRGYLRVCNSAPPYVPKAYLPLPKPQGGSAPKASGGSDVTSDISDVSGTTGSAIEGSAGQSTQIRPGLSATNPALSKEKEETTGRLIKYIAVLLGLVIIGIVLAVFESGRRRRRKRGHGGRRY